MVLKLTPGFSRFLLDFRMARVSGWGGQAGAFNKGPKVCTGRCPNKIQIQKASLVCGPIFARNVPYVTPINPISHPFKFSR